MSNELPLTSQIEHLQRSKYNLGWEEAKGFAGRAAPALVTFGLGAMAATGVGLLAFGFLGAIGIGAATAVTSGLTGTFGGVIPAIMGMGAFCGGLAAVATGLAGAVGSRRAAQEHNQVLDTHIAHVQQQAQAAGIELPKPKVPEVEQPNPAKTNNLVQSLVQKGRTKVEHTFAPQAIVMRAAQDATGVSFEDRLQQERASQSSEVMR